MTCLVFFHVLCYFFSARKEPYFTAGRSRHYRRTIRWLSWRYWSHSQQCLSLLRVTADANELLSHPFDPGIKPERNERHLGKMKMPKSMSRRKSKWKNIRRNINQGKFFDVHPPHHPWVPFRLPHTSILKIFRFRGRFNLQLPEFQLLCLCKWTEKPRYGHSIDGLSVVCVSLFSHFCFCDLKTRVPFC